METQRVHMKGELPCLVRWPVMPVLETFILPWLLWSAQYKIFFFLILQFYFMCPHRPATWAGSLAGQPVS
jgi:hypothetical protein